MGLSPAFRAGTNRSRRDDALDVDNRIPRLLLTWMTSGAGVEQCRGARDLHHALVPTLKLVRVGAALDQGPLRVRHVETAQVQRAQDRPTQGGAPALGFCGGALRPPRWPARPTPRSRPLSRPGPARAARRSPTSTAARPRRASSASDPRRPRVPARGCARVGTRTAAWCECSVRPTVTRGASRAGPCRGPDSMYSGMLRLA